MKEIDYTKLKNFDAQRKKRTVYGYKYLQYCPTIVALKLSDWRYRDVLEFLYTEVEEFVEIPKTNRIDNKDLSKMVNYWKGKNLIDFDRVEIEKKKIASFSQQEKKAPPSYANISVLGAGYSKMEFMKALEKRGVIVQNEVQGIANFYNENASKNDIENLVTQYLNQSSSFLAG
jgi:hypothetical protein